MSKQIKVRTFLADGTEVFRDPVTGKYDPPLSPPIEMQKNVLTILNNRKMAASKGESA